MVDDGWVDAMEFGLYEQLRGDVPQIIPMSTFPHILPLPNAAF